MIDTLLELVHSMFIAPVEALLISPWTPDIVIRALLVSALDLLLISALVVVVPIVLLAGIVWTVNVVRYRFRERLSWAEICQLIVKG